MGPESLPLAPDSPAVQERGRAPPHSPPTLRRKSEAPGPLPGASTAFPRSSSAACSAPSPGRWAAWGKRRGPTAAGELAAPGESGAAAAPGVGPGLTWASPARRSPRAGAGPALGDPNASTSASKGRAGRPEGVEWQPSLSPRAGQHAPPKSPQFPFGLGLCSPRPRGSAPRHPALDLHKAAADGSCAPGSTGGAGLSPPGTPTMRDARPTLPSPSAEHKDDAAGKAAPGLEVPVVEEGPGGEMWYDALGSPPTQGQGAEAGTPPPVPAAPGTGARGTRDLGSKAGGGRRRGLDAALRGEKGAVHVQHNGYASGRAPAGQGPGRSPRGDGILQVDSLGPGQGSRKSGAFPRSSSSASGRSRAVAASQSKKSSLSSSLSYNHGQRLNPSSTHHLGALDSESRGVGASRTRANGAPGAAAQEPGRAQRARAKHAWERDKVGADGARVHQAEAAEESGPQADAKGRGAAEDAPRRDAPGAGEEADQAKFLRQRYAQGVRTSSLRLAGMFADAWGREDASCMQPVVAPGQGRRMAGLSLDMGAEDGFQVRASSQSKGNKLGSENARAKESVEPTSGEQQEALEMFLCWGSDKWGTSTAAWAAPATQTSEPRRSSITRSPFSRRRAQDQAPGTAPTPAPGRNEAPPPGTPLRLSMLFGLSKSLRPDVPGHAESKPADTAPPASPLGPAPAPTELPRRPRTVQRGASRGQGGGEAVQGKGLLGVELGDLAELYELGARLGEGRCGVSVRRCVERSTGQAWACKSTPKAMLSEPRKVEALRTEVAILQMLLGSPGIVQLHQVVEDSQEVHMVMELCPGGDLLTHINSCPHISEKQAATFCRLLAQAVLQCHQAGVLHRDLKPENVLITGRGPEAGIRVADFGISAILGEGQRVTGYAGSPYYVAPEVLTGAYGFEADVWSLGVVLYVLLCQHLPFWDSDDAQIYQAILQRRYDTRSGAWLAASAAGIDLVRRMLCLDPRRRITLPKLLEHPWITQNQLSDLSHLVPAAPEPPELRLSRRRRAIARSEGAVLGTFSPSAWLQCSTPPAVTLSARGRHFCWMATRSCRRGHMDSPCLHNLLPLKPKEKKIRFYVPVTTEPFGTCLPL